MAASDETLAAVPVPLTRCNNCQTVFEVSRDIIDSADPRVRCGECLSVFDALSGLHRSGAILDDDAAAGAASERVQDEGPEFRQSTSSQPISADDFTADIGNGTAGEFDATYSDFDLFSDMSNLPEAAFMDDSQDLPDLDLDQVAAFHDKTLSDTLFKSADVGLESDLPLGPSTHAQTVDLSSRRNLPRNVSNDPTISSELLADGPEADDTQEPATRTIEFDFRSDEERSLTVAPPAQVVTPALQKTSAAELIEKRNDAVVESPSDSIVEPAGQGVAADVDPTVVPPAAVSGKRSPRRAFRWLLYPMLLLLLGGLLLGLFAYRERGNLANTDWGRPLLSLWCKIDGCSVPMRFDSSRIRILRRQVYTHPELPNALVINVILKNTAEFEQRYPILEVSLSDIAGRPVATRDFTPDVYMRPSVWVESDSIASNETLNITLEVMDPGDNADSFELKFR